MKKRERNVQKPDYEKQGGNKAAYLPAPNLNAPFLSCTCRLIDAPQLHRMRTPPPTAMVDVPTSSFWDSFVIPKKRQRLWDTYRKAEA
jgi:hypothetical protein